MCTYCLLTFLWHLLEYPESLSAQSQSEIHRTNQLPESLCIWGTLKSCSKCGTRWGRVCCIILLANQKSMDLCSVCLLLFKKKMWFFSVRQCWTKIETVKRKLVKLVIILWMYSVMTFKACLFNEANMQSHLKKSSHFCGQSCSNKAWKEQ